MADNIVEELLIKIGVDSKGVDSGIQNAVKKASFSLKNALTSFIAPVMGALLSGQFIKQTYEEIMQIDHLSQALGVNAERLQMWQGAAKNAGSSGEALGSVWQRMNAMLTEYATSGKGTMAELAEQGVVPALKTIDGKVKDTDTYLLELADTFKNMDAQAASGIGRKLGIRDGNLMAFFMQGSGEINQQLMHIKELGVYTNRDVQIAREFDNALNDLSRVMKMTLVPIFRVLTPLISKLGTALVYLSKHFMAFVPVLALVAGMIIKTLIPSILQLFRTIRLLMMNPFALKIMAIAAALIALGLILEDIYVWINGGESVIGEYLGSWEDFSAGAKKAVSDFLERATTLWNQFKEVLQPVIDVINLIGEALMTLIDAFSISEERSSAAWARMKQAALDFFNPVINLLNTLSNKLRAFWDFLSGLPGKITGLNFGAISLNARSASGNVDNSNHTTEVNQNLTFNGVKDGQDAVRLLKENPVPSANGAY